jgi:hypothetical protein
MKRDKARDDRFFSCQDDHELNYVAGLYTDHKKVRQFLREKHDDGTIKYQTHSQIYELISKNLGLNIPE